jgi:TetR/AcrR family transcriptional regulator, repressor for uid operon
MSRISEERSAQILEAAARCFRQQGFHQSSMKEICAEAGMSPGVVYHYFKSKEAIIVAMAQAERHAIIELMAKAHQGATLVSALDLLAESVLQSVQTPGDAALYLEITVEASRHSLLWETVQSADETFVHGLVDLLTSAQERGEIPPSLALFEIAETAGTLIEGFIVRAVTEPNPLSLLPALKTALRRIVGIASA